MRKLTMPELIIESTHLMLEIKGAYDVELYSSPTSDSSTIDIRFINAKGHKYSITYNYEKRENQIFKEIEILDDIEDECFYCNADYNQKDLKEILSRWNL